MEKKSNSVPPFRTVVPFLFLSIQLIGQNLVLNPGFESLKQTFRGRVSDFSPNIWHWMPPTMTSSDLFHVDETVQENFGGLKAKSGNVVAGIFTYVAKDTSSLGKFEYREYLRGTLKERLVPGREYIVSFWVAVPPDFQYLSNNIGARFFTKPVFTLSHKPLLAPPQVNEDAVPDISPGQWTQISGRFMARDTFRYMVIGNFFPNTQTRLSKAAQNGGDIKCYYFIDDVSVEEVGADVALGPPISVPQGIGTAEGIRAGGLVLDKVLFKLNSSELDQVSKVQLDEIANYLAQNPDIAISIEGHTDDIGKEAYNIELSRKRAQTVYAYLIAHNISAGRLRFAGHGSRYPLYMGEKANRELNRRVEFRRVFP